MTPDNRVIEGAISGRADLIVKGDQEMMRLGAFDGVRLLSLRAYLES